MGHFKEIAFCLFLLGSALASLEVVPTEYEVIITTEERHYRDSDDDLKFNGTVNVIFDLNNVPQDKFNIYVNIVQTTEISSVKLEGLMADGTVEAIEISHFKDTDVLTVTCDGTKTLNFTKFGLQVNFQNLLRNDMTGFYRSSYVTEGKKRWLLTTHFEPLYARRAFPCFDDPKLKALFTVELQYPKSLQNYKVLCNSEVEIELEEGEMKVVRCQKTSMPMSTYLLAFTISDFMSTKRVEFKSNYPSSSTRYIATHGRVDIIDNGEGELSLKAAKEAILALANYTELGYALEKIDMVGIPDFSAGAMENWGLVTYRERILFHNEKKNSVQHKQSSVLTISHELVHQWFGNLVTLASWDYIWLNEAFATYVSYIIADRVKDLKTEEWNYLKHILIDEVHFRAFEIDGLVSARPLTQHFKDESHISAAFDDIPYAKGSAILRMWDLSLPKDKFRESLVDYIRENQKKAVYPLDLYKSFKKIAYMEKDVYNSWTENPGYPVVDVKRLGKNEYLLTQSRFFWEKVKTPQPEVVYHLPITYVGSDSPNDNVDTVAKGWLKKKEENMTLNGKWFILNNQQAGYYRVNYEKEHWLALAKALNESKHSGISELSRAQLINDVFSLARSVYKNYVDYDTALNVSSYMRQEKSYFVWKTALKSFDFLMSKLSYNEKALKYFQDYVLEMLKPHYKSLKSTNGTHMELLMTRLMASWACRLEHSECVKEAKELYDKASEYPEVEEVILCTVTQSDSSAWNDVLKKYKTEVDSTRKTMFLSVLGCTNDGNNVNQLLEMTLKKDSDIRKQDCSSALAAVYGGSPKNVEAAMKFIENKYEEIARHYGGINALGKAITGIAKKLHTSDDVKRMEELVKKIRANTNVVVLPGDLDRALSTVRSNEEWIRERAKDIYNSSSTFSLSFSLLVLCSIFMYQF